MKPAAALVLLGAALILISGAYGDMCPAVTDAVNVFIYGTPDEYITFLAKYVKDDPKVLERSRSLKECTDGKFSEDDKENMSSVLDKIYASRFC